VIEEEDFHQLW